jgi:tetratricopeptide (TPR) repeat protein
VVDLATVAVDDDDDDDGLFWAELSAMLERVGDFCQFEVGMTDDYAAVGMYIRAMEAVYRVHGDEDCGAYARLFGKTGDAFYEMREFELALKQYERALRMREDIYSKYVNLLICCNFV